jgi:hypothetical protein
MGPALVQCGSIPAIAFVAGTKLLAAAGKDGNLALWLGRDDGGCHRLDQISAVRR